MPVFLPEVRPFALVWKVFLFWLVCLCLFIYSLYILDPGSVPLGKKEKSCGFLCSG